MTLSISTVEEARQRADRIRQGLGQIGPLILEAWQARDWEVLGYGSWQEYVIGELGGPLRLGRNERKAAVVELRQEGLSTRAIGGALGVDPMTVHRDLATVANATDALPETITGLDGKVRPAMGVHYSSETPEWYTPQSVVERVVATLGAIDLDPCADPGHRIPAARHFTEAQDGLVQDWAGRVYMNPPYGRTVGDWVEKLAQSFGRGGVESAVALLPARTDTAWFRQVPAEVVCFIAGRLAFSDSAVGAPFPSVAMYLGPAPDRFIASFADFGLIYRRVEP